MAQSSATMGGLITVDTCETESLFLGGTRVRSERTAQRGEVDDSVTR